MAKYTKDQAAWMLINVSIRCVNCETEDTPLWRRGWYDEFLEHYLPLCNACGIKYCKNQYCPECNIIYNISHIRNNPEYWIKCMTCSRYVHRCCIHHDEYQCTNCR